MSKYISLLPFLMGIVSLPSTSAAQTGERDTFELATTSVAAGDSLEAIRILRLLTVEQPDRAEAWGLLGKVLTMRASSVSTDFSDRLEAEKALNKALELEPRNPSFLMSLAWLKRKQQMYNDARRVMRWAATQLQAQPHKLPGPEEAEVWYALGVFAEDAYLDTRHLVWVPKLPVSSDCVAPVFCLNFQEPETFNSYLANGKDLSFFGEDDYQWMMESFDRALRADPVHEAAFQRLVVHLIDRGEYGEALRRADAFCERAPRNAWCHLMAGLIHQRAGRDSLASLRFATGLDLLDAESASHLKDVRHVLRRRVAEKYEHMSASQRHALEDYLWDRSDPLYLSDVNEVYVAHLARVLFADLMFGDPSRRRWGSDTDRGTILVRYGPPHSEWQLARDGGKEMSETEIASAYAIMKDGDGASDPLNINQTSWHHGGGRWIFFNYGTDQPSFVFAKQLRWREVRHIGDSYSSQWANELREMDPARYVPSFPVEELPVQVARFRGESEGEVEVDFYTAMPSTQSGITDDSLQVGLFAFDENYRRVIEQRRVIATHKSSTPVTFSVPMLLGKYSVSVEGRGVAGAAVYRDSLVVGRFPPDSLSMSDLVIAYTVTPRVRNPAERRDFAIQTNQRLTLARNDLLALYWELYGLGLDDEGLAHYLVTITIEGSGGEQAGLARIVRAIGVALGVAGERESPELRYERVARPVDGRAMEYMDLHVDFEKPGEYTVFMRIVDLNSQMEKEIKRTVLISEG